MSVRITNIQHFCLHDGPGIRTTVFLKGCNLRCPWCANPECISNEIEDGFGYDISLDKLKEDILKDEIYYSKNDGGVTFSGGEPLLQIKNLKNLLIDLKSKNINICFETALFVNKNLLEIAMPYVDEFIVDVKILSKEECKDILGGNVDTYLKNLKLLKNKKVMFRIPLVQEYTLTEDNTKLILELLNDYPDYKVEIFKIHNLAESKYKILGKKQYFEEIDDNTVNEFLNKLKNVVDNVEIIEL